MIKNEQRNISELEDKLGYKFINKDLILLALTHCSVNNKSNHNNERLEFLGDRVLGFVIADFLYSTNSDKDEGFLSKFLSMLISKETLSAIAEEIDLCSYILKQDCNASLGADALEAVIAAIYIDSCSLDKIRSIIYKFWQPYIHNYLQGDMYSSFNPKSTIQEWSQKNKLPIPCYIDVKKEGTEHEPVFYVKVCIEGYGGIEGIGSSKKIAQKDACMKFIEKYNILKLQSK